VVERRVKEGFEENICSCHQEIEDKLGYVAGERYNLIVLAYLEFYKKN
jgi:hypothetical protein